MDYSSIADFFGQLDTEIVPEIRRLRAELQELVDRRNHVICELLALQAPWREIQLHADVSSYTVASVRNSGCPQARKVNRRL